MKATVYRVVLSILDTDDMTTGEIKSVIENQRYPNWCISPMVREVQSVVIEDFDDDHPINTKSTAEETFKRLFSGGNA